MEEEKEKLSKEDVKRILEGCRGIHKAIYKLTNLDRKITI